MKTFFDIIKLSFLILGAVLGAGFTSGRELLTFFSLYGFIPFYVLSCLFFLIYVLVLFLSNGNQNFLVRFGLIISSFSIAVCSASGINELFNGCVISFPIYSLLFIILGFYISKNGIERLSGLSVFTVPALLISTLFVIISKGDFIYFNARSDAGFRFIKAILYASFNAFVNIKVILSAGKGKSKQVLFSSAFLSFFILLSLGVLILLSLSEKEKTLNFSQIPILLLSQNNLEEFALKSSLFFSMFFSLTSSIFSLKNLLIKGDEKRKTKMIVLLLVLWFFSFFKIDKVIKYFYPFIGAIGLTYFCFCIKNLALTIINKKEKKMSKKNKIKKLTDEEYQRYIMSLKDEKPPFIVKNTQKNS